MDINKLANTFAEMKEHFELDYAAVLMGCNSNHVEVRRNLDSKYGKYASGIYAVESDDLMDINDHVMVVTNVNGSQYHAIVKHLSENGYLVSTAHKYVALHISEKKE